MKRVLIADDDAAIRSFLAQALADEGYVVATAENGAIALARCEEFVPDLIVLDLTMPIADGFHFLHHRRERCPAPVVVISAAPDAETLTDDLGVSAFVAKPFDVRVLVETLAQPQFAR